MDDVRSGGRAAAAGRGEATGAAAAAVGVPVLDDIQGAFTLVCELRLISPACKEEAPAVARLNFIVKFRRWFKFEGLQGDEFRGRCRTVSGWLYPATSQRELADSVSSRLFEYREQLCGDNVAPEVEVDAFCARIFLHDSGQPDPKRVALSKPYREVPHTNPYLDATDRRWCIKQRGREGPWDFKPRPRLVHQS